MICGKRTRTLGTEESAARLDPSDPPLATVRSKALEWSRAVRCPMTREAFRHEPVSFGHRFGGVGYSLELTIAGFFLGETHIF